MHLQTPVSDGRVCCMGRLESLVHPPLIQIQKTRTNVDFIHVIEDSCAFFLSISFFLPFLGTAALVFLLPGSPAHTYHVK
jgi:hypothetical protein